MERKSVQRSVETPVSEGYQPAKMTFKAFLSTQSDDITDEDAMAALKGMAFSFRVVNSNLTQTSADMRSRQILYELYYYSGFVFS